MYLNYYISPNPCFVLTYKDTYSLVLDAFIVGNIINTHQILAAITLLQVYLPLQLLRGIHWIYMFTALKKRSLNSTGLQRQKEDSDKRLKSHMY